MTRTTIAALPMVELIDGASARLISKADYAKEHGASRVHNATILPPISLPKER